MQAEEPIILCIESSGQVCSICVNYKGNVLEESLNEANMHSKVLAPMIASLLADNGIITSDLDAIAISIGPGSYTGLRIGSSLAKGMCFSLDIPLLGVPSLQAIAMSAAELKEGGAYLSLVDARRDDVFVGRYQSDFSSVGVEKFLTLEPATLEELRVDENTVVCGSGAEKFFKLFPETIGVNCSESTLYSRHLLPFALQRFADSDFEDLTYFEPRYLKSVFVTKPKPKF